MLKAIFENHGITPKQALVIILKSGGIIEDQFTGQVILHFGKGGLCEVECVERKKKSLDNFQIRGK